LKKILSSGMCSQNKKLIYHFTIMIDCSPKVVLLATDLHEDFVDKDRIALSSVLRFKSATVNCSEFYAPETD
jgi:hypothetical protein